MEHRILKNIDKGAMIFYSLLLAFLLGTGFSANAQLGGYYKSKGHHKNKGLNFGVQKPLGFIQKEANRPNIVQKWVKGSGKNIIMLGVMVKQLPYEMRGFSKADWVDYLKNEKGYKDFADEKATNVKYIVLDNHAGVGMDSTMSIDRLDVSFTGYIRQYMAIVGDNLFTVQLVTNTKANLDKYKALHYKMANSVVFYDQYGN